MTNDTTPGKQEAAVIAFPENKAMNDSVEQQASKWMAKLDNEQVSVQTRQAFKAWVNADPAHRAAFEGVIEFWDDINILSQAQLPREQGHTTTEQQSSWLSQTRYALASVFTVAIAIALLLFNQAPEPQLYTTAIGEQKTINLSDNSTVLLNTNSQLQVVYSNSKRRLNLISGEAHFEVAHNPQRPFEVYAGKGLVRAIGTAFTVHLRKVDVEVIVTEGTVEIDQAQPTKLAAVRPDKATANVAEKPVTHVRVKAGNKGVYSRELMDQVKLTVAHQVEEQLSWQKGLLAFDGEPLAEVVAEVGRYTELKIIIPERKVRELKVGGLFKVGDTDSLFEALRDGFDVHVEKVSGDMVYLISSENRKK